MKKIISAFLAMLMLVTVVACNKGDNNKNDVTTNDSTTSVDKEESPLYADPNLPKRDFSGKDFGGENFTILTVDHTEDYNEFSVFEDSVDALDSKVYRRNEAINEKYSVKIDTIHKSNPEIVGYVGTQRDAGTISFDAINTGYTYQCSLINLGLIIDMNELPYIDTDKHYWNQQALSDANICGKNFFLVSTANIWSMHSTQVCFFNTQLCEDLGLESPYDLVDADEWTFEAFKTMTKVAYKDLDNIPGKSVDDRFGVVSTPVGPEAMFGAFGGKYITKDSTNTPVSNTFTEETYSLLTDIIEYWCEDEAGLGSDGVGIAHLATGNALFAIEQISALPWFNDTPFIVGIAPLPKYDDNQEKLITPVHPDWSTSFSVPFTANKEKVGAILEDIAYLSYRDIRPEYYDINLKARRVQDETSIRMLDLIFENISFDLGSSLSNVGYAGRAIARGLVAEKKTDVASAFDAQKDTYESILNNFIANING